MRYIFSTYLYFVICLFIATSSVSITKRPNTTHGISNLNKKVTILSSLVLSEEIRETSGLIFYNDFLYTHNDDSDSHLYKIDQKKGSICQRIPFPYIKNIDWESITQDNEFIYIGDFGNNGTGVRSNLVIYKINKNSLDQTPIIEKINFDYENRMIQKTQKANATDYDCEAFVSIGDSLYLFTKEWLSHQTTVYVLPKKKGTYEAKKQQSYAVDGLITDATWDNSRNRVILTGYSSHLQPFIVSINHFLDKNTSLHSINKYKLDLSFHQIEGITVTPEGIIYITNEQFKRKFIANVPAQLHEVEFK